MERVLYMLAAGLVRVLQALPIRWVARIGRAGGALAWYLDGRHRRVAMANLERCFGDTLGPGGIRATARENFRRLGENYACAVKTAGMEDAELARHMEVTGAGLIRTGPVAEGAGRSCVIAIGHFGNFELYARMRPLFPGYLCGTTYRGLRQESINRLMQSLREKSGCRYFERRRDVAALRAAMAGRGLLLGLLADQHAGDGGLRMPFFGMDCSTSPAPALFALRYRCPLHTAICYRTGLARWRVEVGGEIPTFEGGSPRTTVAIMADVNRVFEEAVRRDPANWFWVHRRWKPAPPGRGGGTSVPGPAPAPSSAPAADCTGVSPMEAGS